MAEEIVYVKAERNVEVMEENVFLKDLAKVTCRDKSILAKAKALKVYTFKKGEIRQVISIMKIIELLQELEPNITVECIGEMDTIMELVKVDKLKGPKQWWKIALVACVSFFGTGFTIMAFHNDIGIDELFSHIYGLVMGEEADGYSVLEFAYSAGLAMGIIVFFNHIGGRRITKDPTPIEVAMRTYEEDVNTALIETANREGKEIDVN